MAWHGMHMAVWLVGGGGGGGGKGKSAITESFANALLLFVFYLKK